MRKAYLLLTLLICTTPALAAEPPTISVRGEGELKVAPDVAIVNLRVRTKAKDAKAAQTANAKELARVMSAVKKDFSLPEKDIQTAGFFVNPDYRYEKDGRQVFLGYVAEHELTLRVKQLDRLGALLDAVPSGKGGEDTATLLQGVSFDSDARREHETQALGLAMGNAQARAAALAGFAKRGLRGVRRITDSNVQFQPFRAEGAPRAKMMGMAADAAVGGAGGTQVAPGEITINASVGVDYEME